MMYMRTIALVMPGAASHATLRASSMMIIRDEVKVRGTANDSHCSGNTREAR